MKYLFNDSIVAISTPVGNGGIGIVRISGKDESIKGLINKLFDKKDLEVQKAQLLPLYDQNKDLVDRAIVIYFQAPRSYTGESVLEIQAHGGQVLMKWIVEIILEQGKSLNVRLAEPGEFTQRAFLNGKLDLVQAESVIDLINATSKNAIKAASRSLKGDFSKKITDVNSLLTRLRIEVEAILDFPEEEINYLEDYKIKEQFEEIDRQLDLILLDSKQGEILRDGIRVALVGPTNVGKSSLLNALAGDDIAIVSDVEGTTRDKVQTIIHIEGIPFHIIDTAGIRDTSDVVEKIGIQRSKNEISKADIILEVMDARNILDSHDEVSLIVRDIAGSNVPIVTVVNKIDLNNNISCGRDSLNENLVRTSAINGEGIEDIKRILLEKSGWTNTESIFIARERHIQGLKAAQKHLRKAKDNFNDENYLEFFAEELRLASDELGNIVGKTSSDDLLGMIFAGFCIGK